jgi:hypothetical protein
VQHVVAAPKLIAIRIYDGRAIFPVIMTFVIYKAISVDKKFATGFEERGYGFPDV